jgi:cytidylate kinase
LNLIIAISGLHGTGKSTYAKQLANDFGLNYVSAGALFREIAKEKGLTIEELSNLAEKDNGLDKRIDDRTLSWVYKGSVVIDALLAGWITGERETIKIHMVSPDSVRLERIAERDKINFQEAKNRTLKRENCEKMRFKRRYGIELDDLTIYDLVLNTSLLPIKSNIKLLRELINEYLRTRNEVT